MATAIAPFESALEEIVRERRQVDAAEAAWLAKVADYAVSGGWAADNYLSAAAAIGDHCRLTRAAATAAVRLAVKLLQLPELAAAYAAGETSRAHVEVVTRAYTRDRAAEFDQHQDALTLLAVNATPRTCTKRSHGSLTPSMVTAAPQVTTRSTKCAACTARRRRAGYAGHGSSTPKWKPLTSTTTPAPPPNDAPTRSSISAGSPSPTARTRPAPPSAAGASRTGCGSSTSACSNRPAPSSSPRSAPSTPPADGSPKRRSSGCYATATWPGWSWSPSEVLDLGRSTRTPSDKQFRALVVRDGHCQAKGCKVPWQFCQPHHIKWWTHDGPTDLDNLQLLCWHHHRQAHNHDAQPRPG